MSPRKQPGFALVALLVCTVLRAATIEDSGRIATFDDVYPHPAPAPPGPEQPRRRQAAPPRSAASPRPVVAPRPAAVLRPPASPHPAAADDARSLVRAADSVAAPTPASEAVQVTRHVPAPVVSLQSGFEPADSVRGGRRFPAPVVTIQAPAQAGAADSN
jgi:hypothetical protein